MKLFFFLLGSREFSLAWLMGSCNVIGWAHAGSMTLVQFLEHHLNLLLATLAITEIKLAFIG